MQELIKKAGILIEALPYIQKFAGRTVVVKYGGNAMINEDLKNSVMEDITLLKFIGLNPIVVHGGGPDISKALDERGVKSKFINGLRVTDDITMQTAQQVLIGKTAVNTAYSYSASALCVKQRYNFLISFSYKYLLSSLHCDVILSDQLEIVA